MINLVLGGSSKRVVVEWLFADVAVETGQSAVSFQKMRQGRPFNPFPAVVLVTALQGASGCYTRIQSCSDRWFPIT